MDVSVIIPVYNNFELTKKCIESIFNYTSLSKYEVIVADDCSTDNTPKAIRAFQYQHSNLKYLRNNENRGFAYTCNRGAQISDGKFLLFLNNDTIVNQNFVDAFLFENRVLHNPGISGCKLLYEDDTIQHGGVLIYPNKNVEHLFRFFPKNYEEANRYIELSAVTAACMFIEKELFFSVGMFDERFMNGFEDIDLCFKVKKTGKKIVYIPNIEIYHLESKTRNTFDENNDNETLLTEKWGKYISPDWWILEKGYNFKINEEGVFYLVKKNMLNYNECPNEQLELKHLTEKDPLEFIAFKKLIQLYIKNNDFLNAIKLAGKLFQFEPVSENLIMLKTLIKKLGEPVKDIENYIFEKKLTIDRNKKSMRAISRKFLNEGKFKTGVYYAEWLKNYIGDYSSQKIFYEYLLKIKEQDKNFFKFWDRYFEESKETVSKLKREKFSHG